MEIQQNMGKFDRIIRAIGGLALISLTVIGPKTFWGFLGAIPVTTAVFGICPLYLILRISTLTSKKNDPNDPSASSGGYLSEM